MSTILVLKNINPADYVVEPKPSVTKLTPKTKYDLLNPGEVDHISNAGGIIRVLKRGSIYDKQGNLYDRECGKPCWWHRHAFDGLAMGIPIHATEDEIYMDGVFCSYECVYTYLLDHFEKSIVHRDPNYSNSIVLLEQLFQQEFKGQELKPALDWRLLKDVGNGSLSVKDFTIGLKGIRTIPHPNFIFKSVTITYDVLQ